MSTQASDPSVDSLASTGETWGVNRHTTRCTHIASARYIGFIRAILHEEDCELFIRIRIPWSRIAAEGYRLVKRG